MGTQYENDFGWLPQIQPVDGHKVNVNNIFQEMYMLGKHLWRNKSLLQKKHIRVVLGDISELRWTWQGNLEEDYPTVNPHLTDRLKTINLQCIFCFIRY